MYWDSVLFNGHAALIKDIVMCISILFIYQRMVSKSFRCMRKLEYTYCYLIYTLYISDNRLTSIVLLIFRIFVIFRVKTFVVFLVLYQESMKYFSDMNYDIPQLLLRSSHKRFFELNKWF